VSQHEQAECSVAIGRAGALGDGRANAEQQNQEGGCDHPSHYFLPCLSQFSFSNATITHGVASAIISTLRRARAFPRTYRNTELGSKMFKNVHLPA